MLFREGDALVAGEASHLVGQFEVPSRLALSGLVWPEAAAYIARTAWLIRESAGRGQTILFCTDPVFRGYSLGTERLLLNSVLLGPAFRRT